ncbi:Tropomodulin [Dictyocaulus viviparus]|uniref:Tropomodulin n=1 Tax=Dictyocaulus viviparus TaxID=29172 RepID=A0A0D8Y1D9_DICVI|nr:Tropomodulin [Dictyocaulus viviparus]
MADGESLTHTTNAIQNNDLMTDEDFVKAIEAMGDETEADIGDLLKAMNENRIISWEEAERILMDTNNSPVKSSLPEQVRPTEPDNDTDVDQCIQKLLDNDPHLKEINLNNMKRTPIPQIRRLLEAMAYNEHCERLSLANMGLYDNDIAVLLTVIEMNTALRKLNLETNYLSGDFFAKLFRAALVNQTLEEVKAVNQGVSFATLAEKEIIDCIVANTGLLKISVNLRLPEGRHKIENATLRNGEYKRILRREAAKKAKYEAEELAKNPVPHLPKESKPEPNKPATKSSPKELPSKTNDVKETVLKPSSLSGKKPPTKPSSSSVTNPTVSSVAKEKKPVLSNLKKPTASAESSEVVPEVQALPRKKMDEPHTQNTGGKKINSKIMALSSRFMNGDANATSFTMSCGSTIRNKPAEPLKKSTTLLEKDGQQLLEIEKNSKPNRITKITKPNPLQNEPEEKWVENGLDSKVEKSATSDIAQVPRRLLKDQKEATLILDSKGKDDVKIVEVSASKTDTKDKQKKVPRKVEENGPKKQLMANETDKIKNNSQLPEKLTAPNTRADIKDSPPLKDKVKSSACGTILKKSEDESASKEDDTTPRKFVAKTNGILPTEKKAVGSVKTRKKIKQNESKLEGTGDSSEKDSASVVKTMKEDLPAAEPESERSPEKVENCMSPDELAQETTKSAESVGNNATKKRMSITSKIG